MKKFLATLATLVTALVLAVTATGGFNAPMSVVAPAQPSPDFALTVGETIKGIVGFANGTMTSAFGMIRGDYVFVAWPRGDNWGITLIDAKSGKLATDVLVQSLGQKMGTLTLAQLVKALEGAGWKYITSTELPNSILSTFGTASQWLRQLSSLSMPTILVVPVGVFDNPPVPLYQKIIQQ